MARTSTSASTDVLNAFVNLLADAVASRLGSGAAAAPARSTARATARVPAAPRRKGQKRDPALLAHTTDSLLAFIKTNKGQRIEEISKSLGVSTKELALPAKKLISTKKIKTKGQRRATRYFPA